MICKYFSSSQTYEFHYRYIPYIESYTDNLILYNKIEKDRDSFKQYLLKQLQDPACNGLDLSSYLIMPVQRLPRYS